MEREVVKISALKAAPYNPRQISGEALSGLSKSLERWGVVQEVVANRRTGYIVGGHQRVAALKKMGVKEVPVVWVDLDEVEEKALNVALNNPHISGEFDDTIAGLLTEIRDGIGPDDFVELKLDDLLPPDAEVVEGNTDPDDVPEAPEEPITKPGDLWILGNHRLLCGDSTNIQHVERLMGGEKADMVFTDPPYGMFLDTDYDAMFAADKTHRKTGKRFQEVAGDHEDFAPELINTIFTAFSNAKEIFVWGADYFSELIPDRKEGSWIVWDKRTNENMDKVSGNTFEMCWSKQKHKRLIARIMWSGHHGMQKDDTRTRVHPTQKPVELATWFFDKWGKETTTVADLFGGSGSTLIACEKTSRHCRMMELDPTYCDVIIKRWEDFTGKKATLEANDATG